jgi:hypothetical protein
MTEPQDSTDAASPNEPAGVAPGPQAGEDLARRLADHVAAYEVDPPAPARAAGDDEGDGPPSRG